MLERFLCIDFEASALDNGYPIEVGVAEVREARRVLKPGGRMLFSVWDRIDRIPPSHAVVAGLQRRYPAHPSWFLERTPSGYHDPDIIRADLRAAGFADCRIDTVVRTGHAASPRGVALGLCQGSP